MWPNPSSLTFTPSAFAGLAIAVRAAGGGSGPMSGKSKSRSAELVFADLEAAGGAAGRSLKANFLANSLAVATQASCTANNPEDHSHSFSGDQSPVEPPKWTISEPLWKTVIRRRQFHSEFLRKKPCGFLYGFSVAFSMDFLWVFVMGLNLFLPWFLCAQNTAKRAP